MQMYPPPRNTLSRDLRRTRRATRTRPPGARHSPANDTAPEARVAVLLAGREGGIGLDTGSDTAYHWKK